MKFIKLLIKFLFILLIGVLSITSFAMALHLIKTIIGLFIIAIVILIEIAFVTFIWMFD